MGKIILMPPKWREECNSRHLSIAWKKSLPFVDNPRGLLIHRARSVRTFFWDGEQKHSHVDYFCGNGCNFQENVFVECPGVDRILCAHCESIAIAHGYKPAEEIAGRHVHVGGIRAYKMCCQPEGN